MVEKSHLPCIFVGCESSDAFSYNTEKQIGKCYSCDKSYPHKGMLLKDGTEEKYPLKDSKVVHPDPFASDTSVVADTYVKPQTGGTYRSYRGINSSVMEFYGVKTTDKQQTYPYSNGQTKVRVLPKDFSRNAGFKTNSLFGSNLFPTGCSRKITICEGELDALSAYQMLSGGGYINPVVSVPSATPAKEFFSKTYKYLNSFEQINLSVDPDDAGDKLAEQLFDLFPDKVYLINHGEYKDANEFLTNGAAKAYKSAWWSATKYSPAGFTAGAEDWLKAVHTETPYEYTPTFCEGLNDCIRGWVKGGITIVKAPAGTGKTSVFRAAMHDLVINKGQRVGSLMMEELKSTTARGMATYHLGVNVNTEEDQKFYGITNESLDIAITEVVEDNKFVAFEINPQDPIEDTLKQLKYSVAVFGCDYVFVDHLQRLAYLSGTDTATASLTELGVRMVEFAKRRNIGIICISHVNDNGRTKYAASIEEEAIQVMELKRDMTGEGSDANTTDITVTKNRPYSRLGDAGKVEYDPETTIVRGV